VKDGDAVQREIERGKLLARAFASAAAISAAETAMPVLARSIRSNCRE